ncbi:Choline transporter-like 1 [Durusdinium trenchii]|uniref:Choline transporter-like protein n=1 Tax=Durusdinium trenchii TaxID=1381693 RepID=A0ABP0SI46_9DINO
MTSQHLSPNARVMAASGHHAHMNGSGPVRQASLAKSLPPGLPHLAVASGTPKTGTPVNAQDSDEELSGTPKARETSTDPKDKGFNPSTVPRECTDVFWIIPFIICLGLTVFIWNDAIKNGNLHDLVSLPDLNGNLCGHGVNRDKPFLYFCMQQSSQWVFQGNDKRLDMANPVCVGMCPGTYNTSTRCWLPLNQTYAWVQDYPTQAFIGMLCRPSRKFTQSLSDQFMTFVQTAPPVASFSMIMRAWTAFITVAIVALVFSYLFIVALSFCAPCLVLAGVLIVVTASFASSAYLFWCSRKDAQRTDLCGISEGASAEESIAAWSLLVLGFIFLWIGCQMSAWMETAVKCISWSCKCILATPSLSLLPPTTLALRGVSLYGFIYVCLMLASKGIGKYSWATKSSSTEYSTDVHWMAQAIDLSPLEWVCLVGTIFMGLWVQGLITAWTHFVQLYTSQMWYFSGGIRGTGSAPVLSVFRAGCVGIRYHLGSLIGGGLKQVLALPFRLTLGWLLEASQNQYNPVSYVISGCCDTCLGCYKRFFTLMSRNAYMDVSLQATAFNEASEHVNAILAMQHEASAMALLNGATWLFQLVGLAAIASIGHLAMGMEIQVVDRFHNLRSPDYVQQPELLCVAGALLALAIAFPFMMLFDIVSDSILYCNTVQKMRHQAVTPARVVAEIDRACGSRINGLLSGMVGCHCAGRDRPNEEEWGLLSRMSWRLVYLADCQIEHLQDLKPAGAQCL